MDDVISAINWAILRQRAIPAEVAGKIDLRMWYWLSDLARKYVALHAREEDLPEETRDHAYARRILMEPYEIDFVGGPSKVEGGTSGS